jgi:hypothetical protein
MPSGATPTIAAYYSSSYESSTPPTPSSTLWASYTTAMNSSYYTPPPVPEDIAPPKLKLPSPASNETLTCSEAFLDFQTKFKTCVLPFYVNRPDTTEGADSMARSLVSCLCGSTFKNETLHFQILSQPNCSWPEYIIRQDQFQGIYNSCTSGSVIGGMDSKTIIQTLNLTTVLRDQSLYQPFSSPLANGVGLHWNLFTVFFIFIISFIV